MSIIYKGLNPKHHYGLCILTKDGELITADGKHYQAIQIPTPHGRLIDADAFVKDFTQCYEECRDVGYFSSEKSETIAGVVARGVALDINNAPTILESEETDESNIERD